MLPTLRCLQCKMRKHYTPYAACSLKLSCIDQKSIFEIKLIKEFIDERIVNRTYLENFAKEKYPRVCEAKIPDEFLDPKEELGI